MIITIGIVTLVLVLILYCHRKLNFWQRLGVPTPGLLYQWHYYTRPLGLYDQELHKQLGPTYGVYELLSPILVLGDPDLIREVLIKEFAKFPNHKPFTFYEPIVDQSLFALPGSEDWKRIRSILTPSFTSGKLRGMNYHVRTAIDTLITKFQPVAESGEAVDVFHKLKSLSFDVLLRSAYGVEIDTYSENDDNSISKNLRELLATNYSILFHILFPKLSKLLGIREKAMKPFWYFQGLTEQLINERRSKPAAHDDLLQSMLDANKESADGKTISEMEMKAQSLVFLIAGFHTTAVTMTAALYRAATNPEMQEKIFQEVSQAGPLETLDSVSELKYLEAFLKESLRMTSPSLRVERQCVEKHTLGSITVLPGTIISIPVFAVHNDPKIFTDPETFNPDRFLANGSDVNHHPCGFLPFGGGPRLCIGQRFALMTAKCALARLIQKYRFETTPDTKLVFKNATLDSLDFHEVLLLVKNRN